MASIDFEKEKKGFREYYDGNYQLFEEAVNSLSTLTALLLTDQDAFPTPRVTFRVKDREECINKFSRKYRKSLEESSTEYEIKDHITDIIGIRVICLYETDIELIREVLTKCFDVIEITDKTEAIESKDDVFGYKGLHLDLKLNGERSVLPEYSRISNLQFEAQIRTIVQDAWSVLDHKIKYKRNIPHPLKRRINRMAALFELADQEFVNIKSETIELESKASKVVSTVSDSPQSQVTKESEAIN
ncbi:MAG TPA: (p)ppGpp synthetase, partial [Aeromonadales bacterium]|nr:(p)ppGpp synthetase [Aeromonadales bacterium]